MEDFDPNRYGAAVVRLLALDANGKRLIPLTCGGCSSPEASQILKTLTAADLLPDAPNREAALAGLWLYFSCFEEAHQIAQDSGSPDCELWHAILHRQEPDAGNAAYWFRKVGTHPIYPALARQAARILESYPGAEFRAGRWDPFAFISFCERARAQPGSAQERAALEIQRAEWQILFDHCARPR
ncbi:MAG TPA: hypothetical protein VKX39_03920 [Bryobacteraceae bacterium]|jgi:hypothetical protein|nr:hypothetical protein [Bryobacteraceae bacterium]